MCVCVFFFCVCLFVGHASLDKLELKEDLFVSEERRGREVVDWLRKLAELWWVEFIC